MTDTRLTTVAEAIASRLKEWGVSLVFGIPGTHNLKLFGALEAQGIRIVAAHHEQGLGYAADGYARINGRPGVVITTTGPALTNMLTAVATAQSASVPMLVIAPGLPVRALGRSEGWLHDLPDQRVTVASIVGDSRATRVLTPDAAIASVDDFMKTSLIDRPAVHYIEVPFDGFGATGLEPSRVIAASVAEVAEQALEHRPRPNQNDLEAATAFLLGSNKTAIIAGKGAKDAGDSSPASAGRSMLQ